MRNSLRAISRILFLGILLIGALEGLARSSWSAQYLITPSMGFHDDAFDVQIAYLDAMVERDGKIDCIIVGSSIVEPGLMPTAIAQGYEDYTSQGQTLTCFNFGRWGMHSDMAIELIQILIDKYEPRYLVYGCNPISIGAQTTSDKSLMNSAWFQYRQGQKSTQGWLIEHSASYRYFLRYQSWLDADFRKLLNDTQTIHQIYREDGYRGLAFRSIDVRYPTDAQLPEAEIFKDYINEYNTSWQTSMQKYNPLTYQDSMRKLAELNHYKGTQLILLDMPLHSSFLNYFADGEAGYLKYLSDTRAIIDDYDMVYWQLSDLDFLPDEFWFDRHHLHVAGGYLLSYWLGAQLAVAISQDFAGDVLTQPPLAEVNIPSVDNFFAEIWNPSNEQYIEYQNALPDFDFFPEGTVIFNPNGEHENIKHLQMNILLYYPYARYDIDTRQRDYKHFYILGQARAISDLNLDATQAHDLHQWQETYYPNLLYSANIDYIIYNLYWWSTLSTESQEILQNPAYYQYRGSVGHPSIGSTYVIYKPIFQPAE